MNHTRCSRGLDSLSHGPLSDLVGARGEETAQVERLTHRRDHLWQTRLGAEFLALLLGGGVVAHQGQTLLEAGGDGQKRITGRVGLDPFDHLGEVLVLLANVVSLAEVDEIHDRLGREEEEGVNHLDLIGLISDILSQLVDEQIEK